MNDTVTVAPETDAPPSDRPLFAPPPDQSKLYAALPKAQGAFPGIPKDRTSKMRMKSGGEFTFK